MVCGSFGEQNFTLDVLHGSPSVTDRYALITKRYDMYMSYIEIIQKNNNINNNENKTKCSIQSM